MGDQGTASADVAYPYRGVDGNTCMFNSTGKGTSNVTVSSYQAVPSGDIDALYQAIQNGPLAIAIDAETLGPNLHRRRLRLDLVPQRRQRPGPRGDGGWLRRRQRPGLLARPQLVGRRVWQRRLHQDCGRGQHLRCRHGRGPAGRLSTPLAASRLTPCLWWDFSISHNNV